MVKPYKDCHNQIMQTEKAFKSGQLLQPETGSKVESRKIGKTPGIRGSNAELFEVKVFDGSGNLKNTISKKEIIEREKKINPLPAA